MHVSALFPEPGGCLGLAVIFGQKKLAEGEGSQDPRSPCPPAPWSRHPAGPCHLLTTHSWDPRARRDLRLSPPSLPTAPREGKGALPPAQGKSQINLSDTTANVNSLPCLS